MKRFRSMKTVFVIAAIIGLISFIALYSPAEEGLTASHSADNYIPGSELAVTNIIEYSASLTALGYRIMLPDGWEYVSCAGNGRPDNVKRAADGVIEFIWIAPPAGPLAFTYTVFVPEGETGEKEIISEVLYRIGSGSEQAVSPHPLLIVRSEAGPAFVAAAHSADNYIPGGNLEVTNIIEYTGSLTALGFQAILPGGWSFVAAAGSDAPYIKPQSGAEGRVEFAWIKPPETPITFSYTVSVPENETGQKTLVSTVLFRRAGGEVQEVVNPALLLINAAGDVLPEVETIEPNRGPNGPYPIKITIRGKNFVGGKDNIIRFISKDNLFDVRSSAGNDTAISAEMPVGAPPGTYRIRVINKNGTSHLSDADYTITATSVPVVANVSPSIAGNSTRSDITITGENFTGATAVELYDGVKSFSVQFIIKTEKEISATVPPGLPKGFYDIRITTANGTNAVSAVKFRVSSPLIINHDTAYAYDQEVVVVAQVVTLAVTTDGTLPVKVTLKTDDTKGGPVVSDERLGVVAVIKSGTRITTNGASYSGDINPPVQVKVTEEIAALCGSKNVAVFQMGNPTKRLNLSLNMLVVLTVTRDAAAGAPEVYYLESDGSLTLAGVDGTRNGQEYKKGGTVLTIRTDVPEKGRATYTIGLLIDHMSTFVVGNKSSAPTRGDGDGYCFIATAAFGSPLEPHVKILREVRDRYLLRNSMGQGIVKAYYKYSPPLAGFIARHDVLRAVTRWSLTPVVWVSYVALHSSAWQKFFILFVLSGGIWLVILLSKEKSQRVLYRRKR